MDASSTFSKLTIIFPPGDQLTSILIEKEKDTKLEDLINRLCALRAIDLSKLEKLKIIDCEGNKVNLSKTVGESNLPFIEIKDKTTVKEQKTKITEHKIRQRPSSVKITVGQNCYLPLEDQLFDDEKAALQTAKKIEVAKYFSDEFIVAVLFWKKFDIKLTEEALKNNLAFRKEKGFMNIPKFSELDPRIMDAFFNVPGARDKLGRGVRFVFAGHRIPYANGHTVENTLKWLVWTHYVGMFSDGIDSLRNGVNVVCDFEGYGWKNFDIDFQKQTSAHLTERFPVLFRKILVLNPPTIFSAIRKIMSSMLKNKFFERMEVVNTKDVGKELGKSIDPDNLISQLGGNVKFSRDDCIKLLAEWAERNEERLTSPGRE